MGKRPPIKYPALSESKKGEKNNNWKGDQVSERNARWRAKRWYAVPPGLEIHHIDGNPWNNTPLNVEFLTRREHMAKDGRLQNLIERNKKGHSEETKQKIRRNHANFNGEENPNWKGGVSIIR